MAWQELNEMLLTQPYHWLIQSHFGGLKATLLCPFNFFVMAAALQVEFAQEWLHLSWSFWSIAWRCSKWGRVDPGEQLCWWGGRGGVFLQRVLKKKWEAWWWVTTSSFSTSACRGHVCLHLELITVTTSSENLDVGKSTGILPRLFPWAVRLTVQMCFFQCMVPFPPTTKFMLTF